MQFHVWINDTRPDIARIEEALREIDPSAIVDIDALSRLRVMTIALPAELVDALGRSGYRVALADIDPIPSVCCGGCGG